jgi:PD-(D/E)XK endonuclease
MDIEAFVKQNISSINSSITSFKSGTEYIDVDIKNYLQAKLSSDVQDESVATNLLADLRSHNYVKARIIDIANKYVLYKPHLEKYFQAKVFKNVFSKVDIDELSEISINKVSSSAGVEDLEVKFIKKDLKGLLSKCLYVASQGGFAGDLQHTDYGLRVANEGDSAQFFFIARAMLAGFNCSNVDVRSSRYDAIVDVNSRLIRVQVKGIGSGNNISFFDRDRGGQGIDYTHERNRGQRITKSDCDIYVAVDKQVGTCYIIPMSYADSLSDDAARNVKLEEVSDYLEKWQAIIEFSKS